MDNFNVEQRKSSFSVSNRFKALSPVPHIHPHIELVYLFEGTGTVTSDKQNILLRPGDVFFSFPNQLHYYEVDPARGYVFIVSPDLFPDLHDILFSKVPTHPVIPKDNLPSNIADQLVDIFRCANAQGQFSHIAAKSYMQALLAQLLQKMELTEPILNSDSARQLILYCSEHYTQPLSLELLAKELHLSKDYISHIFSDRLGIYFADFINRLRVEKACQLLVKGGNITEAAYASGFGSIRSFNRNFRQIMGVSTSKYITQDSR